MTEVEYESGEEILYQNGEIVWAKITGFPWWPAVIKDIPDQRNNKFCVNFIADNTHAFVGINKIAKYDELRDDINMNKHMIKGLRKAILEADHMIHITTDPRGQTHAPLTAQHHSQVPTQKQLLKSPLIKPPILQENLPQQKQQYSIKPQPTILDNQNKMEEVLQVENNEEDELIAFGSKAKRQQHVQQLLKQYKLIDIPSMKSKVQVKNSGLQMAVRLNKKKRIFKSKKVVSNKYGNLNQNYIQNMLCRKIFFFLRQKTEITVEQRRKISLHLSKEIFHQFFKLQSSMDDINRLFKWLGLSKPQTIIKYYDNRSTFSLQKDKGSNLTTIEQ